MVMLESQLTKACFLLAGNKKWKFKSEAQQQDCAETLSKRIRTMLAHVRSTSLKGRKPKWYYDIFPAEGDDNTGAEGNAPADGDVDTGATASAENIGGTDT
eukprot:2217368-Karenia_brevis.AAC.1